MKNKLELEILKSCIDDLEELINTEIYDSYSKRIDRYNSTIRTVIIRLRAVKELIDY